MSAESELELRIAALDPQQFERLVYDLVLAEYPNAIHPGSPDAGADVLVPASRDERARVWQAKRYNGRINWSKCEVSLAAALARYDPGTVTFVFPRDLSERELKKFDISLAAPVRIELWTLSTLRARLQSNPRLCNTYFPTVHPDGQAPVAETAAPRDEVTPPATSPEVEVATRHVFISYVREDSSAAMRLAEDLEAGGAEVWLDRDRLTPGVRWQAAVRKAIEDGAFFVACFSKQSAARKRSYMNEEVVIAIEELRKRPGDRAWFIPVLLDPDTLPRRDIGAGETLHDIHYVELSDSWEAGIRRLLSVIHPDIHERAAADKRRARFKSLVATTYDDGDYFESFLAAELNTSAASVSRDDIARHLRMGSPVPPRYLYATDSGAGNWLRLCADPAYRYYWEAVEFWHGSAGKSIAGLVRDQAGRDDFDYVSLGCGTGQKDADLVGHWVRSGADILYYPYDISLPLVTHAVRVVSDEVRPLARERLHIKAVLADFDQLSNMNDVFRQRSNVKVMALLGNSLGSLERELEFLLKLRETMSNSDQLILEVRLKSGELSEPQRNLGLDAEMRFYFGALHDLGLQLDVSRMTFQLAHDVSSIPDTTTCVVEYNDMALDGTHYGKTTLAYIHLYDEKAFLRMLSVVGFEIIESRLGSRSTFLTCVARPRP